MNFAKFLRTTFKRTSRGNGFWYLPANTWLSCQISHDFFWAFYYFFSKNFSIDRFLFWSHLSFTSQFFMSFYLENMTLEDNEFYRATLNIEIFTVQIFPFAEINILEISSIWFICKIDKREESFCGAQVQKLNRH